jgi:hypothetical protein
MGKAEYAPRMQRPTLMLGWRGEMGKRERVVLGGGQRQWGIRENEGVFMQQRRAEIVEHY